MEVGELMSMFIARAPAVSSCRTRCAERCLAEVLMYGIQRLDKYLSNQGD